MARSLALLPLLGLPLYVGSMLAGCAVAAGLPPSSDVAVNQCESNDDCPGGQCVENVCHATNGKLSSVVVTVTPADSGGTYYVDYPSSGDSDINLPSSLALKGKVLVDLKPGDCEPAFIPGSGQTIPTNAIDGAIPPAEIVFRRSRRVPGLPITTYRGFVAENGYSFSLSLPADDYDIYIRPLKQPIDERGDTICPVPPRLLLKQSVTGNLEFKLVDRSTLKVHVVWSKVGSPSGWTVDLIDPSTGYAMSWPRVISPYDLISEDTSDNTYEVTLDYVPTYGPDEKGVLQPLPDSTAVLRLTPPPDLEPDVSSPDDVVAPVILAQLTGAEIDSPAEVRLSTPLPDKVSVLFDLEHDGMPAGGTVVLTAIDLPGFSELPTAFTRTITVDDRGTGVLDLLPGKYRVVATPALACDPTTCLGTTQTIWSIPASPSIQQGKTLEFFESVRVSGRAQVASGAPAVGATVRALPSAAIVDFNVMNQGDARAEVLPRSTFTQVDGQGEFFLRADGGTYDLRVEPNPDTGFAWFVHPQVTVDASADEQALGDLRLPLPIVYKGQVTSGSDDARSVMPSALIRAFVYLSDAGKVVSAPTDGTMAVQVAETHSDSSGDFTLLVPASIVPP